MQALIFIELASSNLKNLRTLQGKSMLLDSSTLGPNQ